MRAGHICFKIVLLSFVAVLTKEKAIAVFAPINSPLEYMELTTKTSDFISRYFIANIFENAFYLMVSLVSPRTSVILRRLQKETILA